MAALMFFASICAAADREERQRWILVTTPALMATFEPLVTLREKQGYQVQVIVDWATAKPDDAAQAILTQLSARKQSDNETLVLIGGTHLNEFTKAHVPSPKGVSGKKKSDTPSQGFGIAAIRNPNGPSAVIGPYEESYAAFGKFAMDALFERAVMDEPATTIGDYW